MATVVWNIGPEHFTREILTYWQDTWGVQNIGLYFSAAYMPLFFHCMFDCPDTLKNYFTPTKLAV
jgi:hypothetical protein